MRRVWVSLSWRALVNVEALNMAETVGNYIKHRRAPIVFYDDATKSYVVKYVPVISGESIGHAYQVWLAEEAVNAGLNVCKLCRRGEFVKYGARPALQEEGLPTEVKNLEVAMQLEKELIKRCVVEDIGGFLVPTSVPVKRTALFYVGYMVPAQDTIKAAVMDPQFHVRHSPSMIGKGEEFPETGQALYYVELGSAVYTASFALDVTGIGRTSTFSVESVVDFKEREKRAKAALKAIYYILAGMFGAKRTRFLPDYRLLSVVAAVSKGAPFNVSPGHSKMFVAKTVERGSVFRDLTGSNVELYTYVDETDIEMPEEIKKSNTLEELVSNIKTTVLNMLKEINQNESAPS